MGKKHHSGKKTDRREFPDADTADPAPRPGQPPADRER
jgi:hypothetical protein